MFFEPLETDDSTFATDVLAGKTLAVIDFWAEWCRPCHAINGWMTRLAQKYGDGILVVRADVEKCPRLIADYAVQAVPTILLLRDGVIVHRQQNELTEADLAALVEMHLLQPAAQI